MNQEMNRDELRHKKFCLKYPICKFEVKEEEETHKDDIHDDADVRNMHFD